MWRTEVADRCLGAYMNTFCVNFYTSGLPGCSFLLLSKFLMMKLHTRKHEVHVMNSLTFIKYAETNFHFPSVIELTVW